MNKLSLKNRNQLISHIVNSSGKKDVSYLPFSNSLNN